MGGRLEIHGEDAAGQDLIVLAHGVRTTADVLLLGFVKSTLDVPAPAKDCSKLTPLRGLSQGQHLAWYRDRSRR